MEKKEIPVVALQNFDKENYRKKLADSERRISEYKNLVRYGISNLMKARFGISGDCFQIFDKRAGGILFKDWEWELIPNQNKLKGIFESKDNGSYCYCIDTDEGKMLRGADTYYYFLTHKAKKQTVDTLMVAEWAHNNIDFINSILGNFPNQNLNNMDRRLLLGVLDNIRNINLIMLNANIIEFSEDNNTLLELSQNTDNSNLQKWFVLHKDITKYMTLLCFSEKIDGYLLDEIKETINNIKELYIADSKRLLKKEDSIFYTKAFRTYREIDNFIENYIAMNYVIGNIKEQCPQVLNRKMNFIGAMYGGLELPFIANEILEQENIMSTILLNKKYSDRNANDLINSNLIKQISDNQKGIYNVLCDDNVLTGKTLQSIINILFTSGVDVNRIAIVRYPSLNRIEQMTAENSAVNVDKFFNYIDGLVFTSPYTKLKSTTNNSLYIDELGIFNKDRRRLLEYLYKNGRYVDNSEVDGIGKMYEKE